MGSSVVHYIILRPVLFGRIASQDFAYIYWGCRCWSVDGVWICYLIIDKSVGYFSEFVIEDGVKLASIVELGKIAGDRPNFAMFLNSDFKN